MPGCMRTTLTLDADVAAMLRRMQQAHGRSFKVVVTMRCGKVCDRWPPLPGRRLITRHLSPISDGA